MTQAAGALCEPDGAIHAAWQELRQAIPAFPVVNTDDTGWRIGSAGAFLMGFFTPMVALFQIRRHHRHQEVMEVLTACSKDCWGPTAAAVTRPGPWMASNNKNV